MLLLLLLYYYYYYYYFYSSSFTYFLTDVILPSDGVYNCYPGCCDCQCYLLVDDKTLSKINFLCIPNIGQNTSDLLLHSFSTLFVF